MPDCRDCSWFEVDLGCKLAGPLENNVPWEDWTEETRRRAAAVCNLAIILKWVPQITGQVLEVGHGVSKVFRRGIRKRRQATWHGIDPKYPSKPVARTYQASAAKMPMFTNDQFDWVVALQSIEHWHEKGDTLEAGFQEIRRVLKPRGRLLMTVPFHVHGAALFWHGREQEFKQQMTGWAQVEYDRWRFDHRPLPALPCWKRAWEIGQRKNLYQGQTVPDSSGQPEGPSAWQLEVVATK